MSVMRALPEAEYVYTRDGKKRVTHEAYSYMITPFAYPPIKVMVYKGHIDHRGSRRRDVEVGEEGGADPFVRKNAAMLGIVGELDDVKMLVAALEKVSLRPAPHLPEWTKRADGHLQEKSRPGRKSKYGNLKD